MKLLIEIPDKTYSKIKNNNYDYGDMNIIIQNGTPLTLGIAKGYCILGLEDKTKSEEEEQMREKINRAVKAINQDMAAHSGTGEEAIQAYCDGLKKALGYLENIGEIKGE